MRSLCFCFAVCLFIIAFSPLGHAGEEVRHRSPTPAVDVHELRCLAANMYYEARNQGTAGMEAVGHVTLNRLRGGFAPTVCDVVWQRSHGVCQFSWVCDHVHVVTDHAMARRAADIAQRLLRGYALDNTSGSLWYHTATLAPRKAKWFGKLKRLAQLGDHVFFRN